MSSRQADGDCNTFLFYFFVMSNFSDNENLTCAFSSMTMFIFGSDSIELKYIKNMLMRWSSSQYWFRFATPSHPMLKMRHYWNLNENIEKPPINLHMGITSFYFRVSATRDVSRTHETFERLWTSKDQASSTLWCVDAQPSKEDVRQVDLCAFFLVINRISHHNWHYTVSEMWVQCGKMKRNNFVTIYSHHF